MSLLSGAYQKDIAASKSIVTTPMRAALPSPGSQAEIERAQIVLDRSQPGLLGTSGSASPVSGRTSNAGLKSSGMVLTGVVTKVVTEEGQAPLADSIRPTTGVVSCITG